MVDLVIIGYFLHDTNIVKGSTYSYIGGASAYSGITACKLGMRVGAVSRVGQDFRYKDMIGCMDQEGVGMQGRTTQFRNIYTSQGRVQEVEDIGGKIGFEDIPESYLDCENFLIAPVIGEVDPKIVPKLKGLGKKVFCNPQGYLRRAVGNKVEYVGLKDHEILKCNVLEASAREIRRMNPGKSDLSQAIKIQGPEIVITTEEHRSVVWDKKKVQEVPAYWVDAVDTTGAGDCFFASFIYEYLKTGDPIKSARFGNAVASIKVRDKGLESILRCKDLRKEAERVMDSKG
jgi:sugar/nucleoside kinase (ribokinase family)